MSTLNSNTRVPTANELLVLALIVIVALLAVGVMLADGIRDSGDRCYPYPVDYTRPARNP